MLYDPKWEVETKPDVHALPTLIAWLEKQPATGAYDYQDCSGRCLLGQYWAAHGLEWVRGSYWQRQQDGGHMWGAYIAGPLPRTFGGALERARALL